MHQPSAEAFSLACHRARRFGIDRVCPLGLAFGLVDCCVSGGIDDDLRRHGTHRGRDPCWIGEVTAQTVRSGTVEGDQFAKRRQAALQLPADLSVLAEKQNFHAPRPS